MIYGPYSPVYFERVNIPDSPIEALQAILGPTEAIWITSSGPKIFKQNLSGVVDDERKVDKYLKIRK